MKACSEYEMLRQIEAELVKKLQATRVLIDMFEPKPKDVKGFYSQLLEQEDNLEINPRLKVLSLQKLVEAIKDVFGSDLYQKVKDNYALACYCWYAKVLFPKTGFSDIGILVGINYQAALYHNKKHEVLLGKYADYENYNQKLNTKYSIKEVKID